MSAARKLHAVPAEPAHPPKDITMLLRAEIEARDWSRVHTTADRRLPAPINSSVRRVRDGETITVRSQAD